MAKAPLKDWWKTFFGPLAGEVMFTPRGGGRARVEVAAIRRRVGIAPGARILDVPCGTGRHAMVFARAGFAVVGLDYSRPYLAAARAAAKAAGLGARLRFVRGDMRRLANHVAPGSFDLAVSLFNSFGYFDRRSDDARVVRQVFEALAPGGVFVVNTLHESGVRARLASPRQWGDEPLPNLFVVDRARYDRRRRKTEGLWTIVDARKSRVRITRHRTSQHVYSHAALKRLLRAAGFRIERSWGMLEGKKLTPTSWHQTIAARKSGARPGRRR